MIENLGNFLLNCKVSSLLHSKAELIRPRRQPLQKSRSFKFSLAFQSETSVHINVKNIMPFKKSLEPKMSSRCNDANKNSALELLQMRQANVI